MTSRMALLGESLAYFLGGAPTFSESKLGSPLDRLVWFLALPQGTLFPILSCVVVLLNRECL